MAFIAGKGFAILNSKAEKGDQKAKELLAKLDSIDQDEADRLFSEILGKGGGGGKGKDKKVKAPGASATDGQGKITEGAGEQPPSGKPKPKASKTPQDKIRKDIGSILPYLRDELDPNLKNLSKTYGVPLEEVQKIYDEEFKPNRKKQSEKQPPTGKVTPKAEQKQTKLSEDAQDLIDDAVYRFETENTVIDEKEFINEAIETWDLTEEEANVAYSRYVDKATINTPSQLQREKEKGTSIEEIVRRNIENDIEPSYTKIAQVYGVPAMSVVDEYDKQIGGGSASENKPENEYKYGYRNPTLQQAVQLQLDKGIELGNKEIKEIADDFGVEISKVNDILFEKQRSAKAQAGQGTEQIDQPKGDPLSNENLKLIFDKYEGNVDSVINDLQKQNIDIDNSDLQGVVDAFAMGYKYDPREATDKIKKGVGQVIQDKIQSDIEPDFQAIADEFGITQEEVIDVYNNQLEQNDAAVEIDTAGANPAPAGAFGDIEPETQQLAAMGNSSQTNPESFADITENFTPDEIDRQEFEAIESATEKINELKAGGNRINNEEAEQVAREFGIPVADVLDIIGDQNDYEPEPTLRQEAETELEKLLGQTGGKLSTSQASKIAQDYGLTVFEVNQIADEWQVKDREALQAIETEYDARAQEIIDGLQYFKDDEIGSEEWNDYELQLLRLEENSPVAAKWLRENRETEAEPTRTVTGQQQVQGQGVQAETPKPAANDNNIGQKAKISLTSGDGMPNSLSNIAFSINDYDIERDFPNIKERGSNGQEAVVREIIAKAPATAQGLADALNKSDIGYINWKPVSEDEKSITIQQVDGSGNKRQLRIGKPIEENERLTKQFIDQVSSTKPAAPAAADTAAKPDRKKVEDAAASLGVDANLLEGLLELLKKVR